MSSALVTACDRLAACARSYVRTSEDFAALRESNSLFEPRPSVKAQLARKAEAAERALMELQVALNVVRRCMP